MSFLVMLCVNFKDPVSLPTLFIVANGEVSSPVSVLCI